MIGETNPYVGPRTFGPSEAALFFGREVEARDLARLVAIEQVTVLYGASGVGKSSLIYARLIPALRREGYVVLPVGRVGGDLSSGAAQVDNIFIFNLLLSLDSGGDPDRLAHVTLSDFLAHLVSKDGEHWTYYPAAGPALPSAKGRLLSDISAKVFLLVIDQFEEIITSHPGRWLERENFFRQLSQALTEYPNLAVVLTLREDYVASLDPYAPLMPDRLRTRFHLERLGVTAALDAVRKPAELAGRPFARGVAERLVEKLRQVRIPGFEGTVSGQYVEPIQLQVTCYQLWEYIKQRPPGLITASDLQKASDVNRALTQFYEETLTAALAEPAAAGISERQLRAWFDEKLITEAGTRGLAHQGDSTTGGLPNGVLGALQRRFLVRSEARGGDMWIELAHDHFIEPIRSSNAAWFPQHLSALQRQAALWEDQGRPDGLLLSGDALAEAERWTQVHEDELKQYERAFLAACQKARAEVAQERRQNRRMRILTVCLGVMVFLALIAAGFGITGQQSAKKAARRAEANELAANAALEINKPEFDPSLALLLAIQGVNSTLSVDGYVAPNADAALQDAVAAAQRINWQRTLTGHNEGIGSADFSPDGQYIVTASVDATARVWDANTGQQVRILTGHTDGVNSAAYSPDGARIVTAGRDWTARIWDAASGQEVGQLTGHTAGVISAAYNPDGAYIVTASNDKTARIWDVATKQEVRRLIGHTADVGRAAYSPNGEYIVTASADGTARIWDASTGKQVHGFDAHASQVRSAAYSPDGRLIVTAGCDRTNFDNVCQNGSVRVWDAATGQEARARIEHTSEVLSAAYSPDGTHIITASADGYARIWDANTGLKMRTLMRHTDWVWSAAYSLDGTRIVTASADGSARIWGASPGQVTSQLAGHDSWVWSAAYSPDDRRIVTASADRTARIWDADTGQNLHQLTGHTAGIGSATFSPDGQYVVTASVDTTARIWDANTGQEVRILTGHTDGVNSAAYSPDGTRIVTTSRDGTARIWNAASGQEVEDLTGHTAGVNSAAYSPDGRFIVTASSDKTARIWDAATGQALRTLAGGPNYVGDAAYSPDGRTIVTAESDGIARIWDATSGQEVGQLHANDGWVRSVTCSPDGRFIITSGCDRLGRENVCQTGSVRVWDATTLQETRSLAGHTAEVLSVAYSQDGTAIVTASADGTARVWIAGIPDLLEEARRLIQRDPPLLTTDEQRQYGLE